MKANLKQVKEFHPWKRNPDGNFDIGIYGNILPWEGGYIGAARDGCGNRHDVISTLKYDKEFNLLSYVKGTHGEDPRCFFYKNKPYAITWNLQAEPLPNNYYPVYYKIINLHTGKVIPLTIEGYDPSPMPVLGKNWIPLERDGELFLILCIDPHLYMVKCDIETGKCTWLPGCKPTSNIDVTISRGGTPFIFNKEHDCYVGFGHRTIHIDYHVPFLYTLSKDFKTLMSGEDIKTGKEFVEDPVSIFYEGDKLYCCTGNWLKFQPYGVADCGKMFLYEVTLT